MADFLDRIQRINQGSDFYAEFEPIDGFLKAEQFYNLYNDMREKMKNNQFLAGVSVFTSKGDHPLIIAKNNRIVEDFQTVREIVGSMQPTQFFENLEEEVEKESIGHLKFDYFEIFFTKLIEKYAVSFLVVDIEEDYILKLNTFLSKFQHIVMEKTYDIGVESNLDEGKGKIENEIDDQKNQNGENDKISDLAKDLKSRLDEII